jgi:homoserine/homoserine lactone efflux protein
LELTLATEIYPLFFITTLVVVFSPGPAAIVVAEQGVGHGAKSAFLGTLGIASANVVYFLLSATGIASLLLASNLVFTAIKWLGVAYLVYLGLSAIFSKSGGLVVRKDVSPAFSAKRFFIKGFVVEISNPKALLYFTALLPQFLNTAQPVAPQLLIMGLTTLVLDLLSYSLYGLLGDRLAHSALKQWVINLINRCAGGFLIFTGLKMATVER